MLDRTLQEIENRSVADVDPLGDPEIEERVRVWPPQHRRDDALVGKYDGQCVRREVVRDGRAVPQHETEVER